MVGNTIVSPPSISILIKLQSVMIFSFTKSSKVIPSTTQAFSKSPNLKLEIVSPPFDGLQNRTFPEVVLMRFSCNKIFCFNSGFKKTFFSNSLNARGSGLMVYVFLLSVQRIKPLDQSMHRYLCMNDPYQNISQGFNSYPPPGTYISRKKSIRDSRKQ